MLKNDEPEYVGSVDMFVILVGLIQDRPEDGTGLPKHIAIIKRTYFTCVEGHIKMLTLHFL